MEAEIGLGTRGVTATPPVAHLLAAADDEGALVERLIHGDPAALETIYERHSRSVYALALHLLADRGTAEEVVQETFLKLWRRPGSYRPERGRLLPWLLGVAHHHAVDLLRRRQLEQRHQIPPPPLADDGPTEIGPAVASDEHDPEGRAYAAERIAVVTHALGALPPTQRQPLELAYYRGLTQVEIADLLGEPLGTIKTRMRLGLQRLRGAPGLAALWSER